MPKQINTPGPGRGLVNRFNLKGRFQPVLDEVIVPVTIVEPEGALTVVQHAVGTQRGAASGAGNQNTIYLINQTGSGALVVVDKVFATSGSALGDEVQIRIATGSFGGGLGLWRDGREAGTPRAVMARIAGGAVVLGTGLYDLTLHGAAIEGPWWMPEGWLMTVIQTNQNTTLDATFHWREIPNIGR